MQMFTQDVPESEVASLMGSPVWRAAGNIYYALKERFAICDYCTRRLSGATTYYVTFCTRTTHAPVGYIAYSPEVEKYELGMLPSNYSGMGPWANSSTPLTIAKGLPYVMRMVNHGSRKKPSAGAAWDGEGKHALHITLRSAPMALFTSSRGALPATPAPLSQQEIYPLLPVIFDNKPIVALPSTLLDKLEQYRDFRDNYAVKRAQLEETARQVFEGEKWLIIPITAGSETRTIRFVIGAIDGNILNNFYHAYAAQRLDNRSGVVDLPADADLPMTVPFRIYRQLSDMPEDLYNSLMGSVTMTGMYIKSQDPSIPSVAMDRAPVFIGRTMPFPEVGAMMWHSDSMPGANFYMVSKT